MSEEKIGELLGDKAKVIQYLKGAEITEEEINKEEHALALLTPFDHEIVFEKASKRYEKWEKKTPHRSLSAKISASKKFLQQVYIERLVRNILSEMGVSGAEQIKYFGLSKKVSKKYDKYSAKALMNVIHGSLHGYVLVNGLDPEIAKIVVLATLKLCKWFQREYGSKIFILKPKCPEEEELEEKEQGES